MLKDRLVCSEALTKVKISTCNAFVPVSSGVCDQFMIVLSFYEKGIEFYIYSHFVALLLLYEWEAHCILKCKFVSNNLIRVLPSVKYLPCIQLPVWLVT